MARPRSSGDMFFLKRKSNATATNDNSLAYSCFKCTKSLKASSINLSDFTNRGISRLFIQLSIRSEEARTAGSGCWLALSARKRRPKLRVKKEAQYCQSDLRGRRFRLALPFNCAPPQPQRTTAPLDGIFCGQLLVPFPFFQRTLLSHP